MNASPNIPSFALNRLASLRAEGSHEGVFTSDLSVGEFTLIRKAGFEPVGLALGSCVYQSGIQYGSWSKNQELETLSAAMYNARELAMSRMRAEASSMNADGVVAVRLEVKRLPFADGALEFMAMGTGIVHAKGHDAFKGPNGQPFTSDLSAQDFYLLLQSGYRPLEMVMGSCVYHVAHRGLFKAMKQAGTNCELENFSQALYEARELAMTRMQVEAAQVKADGILGTDIHEGSHGWESHVIEFFAVGTAVVELGPDHRPERIADPQLVLSVG